MKTKKKAFSLVELVVVILIVTVLAIAVFSGGSAAIKKSRVARTTSDLHNFSIAAETTLTSTPSVANITNNSMSNVGGMAKVVKAFNDELAADYKLKSLTPLTSADLGNIQIVADTADTGKYAIFESAKTDAWGNPYYVIFDSTERHDGTSDFTITVASAGPNANSKIGGTIETDDIFLLSEYSNSNVASTIMDVSDIGDIQCPLANLKIAGNSDTEIAEATYAGITGLTNDSSILTKAKNRGLLSSILNNDSGSNSEPGEQSGSSDPGTTTNTVYASSFTPHNQSLSSCTLVIDTPTNIDNCEFTNVTITGTSSFTISNSCISGGSISSSDALTVNNSMLSGLSVSGSGSVSIQNSSFENVTITASHLTANNSGFNSCSFPADTTLSGDNTYAVGCTFPATTVIIGGIYDIDVSTYVPSGYSAINMPNGAYRVVHAVIDLGI